MGWTSFNINTSAKTDEVLRREFTQDSKGGTRDAWDVIESATVGAQWYAIMCRTSWDECTPDGGTAERKQYYGLICLTQRKALKGKDMTEFYYKDMDESCGPYAYAMPMRMLTKLEQLAPTPEGYAAKWREGVRKHHEQKAAKAKAKRENIKKLQDFMKTHFQVVHIGA
jgi:hypothetical protein